MANCLVKGCVRPHKSRGLCDTHYAYWRRTGVIGERRNKGFEERLWAKVDKAPGLGPNGDCWEWRGYVHHTGYGQICLDNTAKSKTMTHRAAWLSENGEIPNKLWVLHHCDNRLCCNPAHLWLGTPKDNTQDMIAKGRRRKPTQVARGGGCGMAKLTDDIVRAMRAEPPMTFKAMGAKYGVAAGTACKVILRQTWAHVD